MFYRLRFYLLISEAMTAIHLNATFKAVGSPVLGMQNVQIMISAAATI
jgi:hypothetical protein